MCLPESGAIVEKDKKSIAFSSSATDVSEIKIILANTESKWSVKLHGDEKPLFDSCDTENVCLNITGYGGAFLREADNSFSVSWFNGTESKLQLVSAMGKCTKL